MIATFQFVGKIYRPAIFHMLPFIRVEAENRCVDKKELTLVEFSVSRGKVID